MEDRQIGQAQPEDDRDRAVYPAMRSGFFGRCPKCRKGKLYSAFLRVSEHCPACAEPLHHHRADDLPAYLVVILVGHVVVGAFMGIEAMTDWPVWLHLALWVPITLTLAIALIAPTKGAIVGLQWALGLHGFGAQRD